jgi:hypothetical protein
MPGRKLLLLLLNDRGKRHFGKACLMLMVEVVALQGVMWSKR